MLAPLKTACRVLSGKKGVPEDELMEMPLMKKNSYVSYIASESAVVDSVFVTGPGPEDVEALSTPPIEFTICVPPTKNPGVTTQRKVKVHGPHGAFDVTLPEDAVEGATLKYRLAPPPEYRIEVPPDAKPGSEARFMRKDGVEVSVVVPEGHGPGDFFEVTAPVHMVLVPDGVKPGVGLIFRIIGSDVIGEDGVSRQVQECCRAVLPAGVDPGSYFPARLPPPRNAKRTPHGPLE
mmetsp:Transcript_9232/g.21644  ORF Transcript_9232/g.21644 Transcript_9232/m.21644 type:complete len:235 (+) Transcript_9232:26-730(+)